MKKDKDDILKEIKDRFKEAYDATDQFYLDCLDDLRFLNGEQWPSDLKAERDAEGRPCLVINKLQGFADQIIGDIRQNEPSIKVKPVDSRADPKTAEIFTGLIRNIEMQSDAEVAYDTAAESAVYCGVGAWRIGTDYTDDDVFEQDIIISRIKNPLTICWDPSAQKWDKSDGRYCFITEKIPKDDFQEQYPDASLMPFEGGKDTDIYWGDDKNIRVAEYWKKEPFTKTLYLVQQTDPMTGRGGIIYVTEMEPDPARLGPRWKTLNTRKVESHKIKWWKVSQSEILEGPTDWPGKYIPIVMVYGKELNIEGQTNYRGVIRNAKDPQRLYNYSRSTGAEVTSLAPKSPYLVTAKMIANYQHVWDNAHKRNYPYLAYEIDPANVMASPKRAETIKVNTGIQSEILISDQEMHDTSGLQLAALGKKSNEKSGAAILARQREGDVGSYSFYDNLARAMRYSGRILVDLIPKIYDTPRIIRIVNLDKTSQLVPINQPDTTGESLQQIFNLAVGKYDVSVSIGPSYQSERDEAATNMLNLIRVIPAAGPLIADLLVKNLDWPGADEIEKRLKLLLPPQLQGGNGQPAPPPRANPADALALKGQAADVQGKELANEKLFNEMQREKAGITTEGGE